MRISDLRLQISTGCDEKNETCHPERGASAASVTREKTLLEQICNPRSSIWNLQRCPSYAGRVQNALPLVARHRLRRLQVLLAYCALDLVVSGQRAQHPRLFIIGLHRLGGLDELDQPLRVQRRCTQ